MVDTGEERCQNCRGSCNTSLDWDRLVRLHEILTQNDSDIHRFQKRCNFHKVLSVLEHDVKQLFFIVLATSVKAKFYMKIYYWKGLIYCLLRVTFLSKITEALIFKNPKIRKYRSSRSEVFSKEGVLKNFANFTEKHLCQSLFFIKVAGLLQLSDWLLVKISGN